jgi:hypothetical protein
MSYLAQSLLEQDPAFQHRVRAVNTEQAQVFQSDGRADIAATATAVLRDEPGPSAVLLRLAAASPGIGNRVDNGDGTVDQSKVTDADLLAITQANFPTVADLFYDDDGTPKGAP